MHPPVALLSPPRPMSSKWPAWLLALLAFGGLLDASFLTIEHYRGAPLPCALFTGCDTVTNSVYASVGSVPLALLGALYYLVLLILILAAIEGHRPLLLKLATKITVIGLVTSLWLIYLQGFIIKSWCLYCLISATISILLFLLGWWVRGQKVLMTN